MANIGIGLLGVVTTKQITRDRADVIRAAFVTFASASGWSISGSGILFFTSEISSTTGTLGIVTGSKLPEFANAPLSPGFGILIQKTIQGSDFGQARSDADQSQKDLDAFLKSVPEFVLAIFEYFENYG